MNPSKRQRRNDYFLDVTEFVLTDHRYRIPSPKRSPLQPHPNEVKLYLCLTGEPCQQAPSSCQTYPFHDDIDLGAYPSQPTCCY